MPEHGGNLRDAMRRYGAHDWLDLSTGINPHWYPAPPIAGNAWHRLPETDPALAEAAQAFYGAPRMLAVAGTQAAIQALPRLRPPSRVVVSSPSYAEHAHHWNQHGHTMSEAAYSELDAAVDRCDVMVICNPNNPTGAQVPSEQLLQWAGRLAARGGWLVVDEAFGDTVANSVAAQTDRAWQGGGALIVLRSVGKFFGLAGLRLGFVAAPLPLLQDLENMLGPWAVSGPAQHVALAALNDRPWQQAMRERLVQEGERLQALLATYGIRSSGTALFQWWPEPQAEALHEHLARQGIWVRLFPRRARGIRIGLPPDDAGWRRLEQALQLWSQP
ncbi:threonine-phosphate decarboxylase CobD [Pseudoduganella ginsengisoli]|uniref:threonine-phosphate decarboxylase n=1 Tax=Pseudoduganella ginsengisoli TaxID=1462440 RepID=A0A6L6Q9V2_9BURK|nr:threonine-phosphate decarboxylase CobD [Pseudoduganella ginsengisoli]MTW06244.1 threonine-phosphate decarboxylase [Pseudoduganella ginsengisoli]